MEDDAGTRLAGSAAAHVCAPETLVQPVSVFTFCGVINYLLANSNSILQLAVTAVDLYKLWQKF